MLRQFMLMISNGHYAVKEFIHVNGRDMYKLGSLIFVSGFSCNIILYKKLRAYVRLPIFFRINRYLISTELTVLKT